MADFLRRWGKRYRYMVVLDADSVMTGAALVRLVAADGANPHVGIIQTAPRLVYGETLYARIQSFANRLYSPLFLAGINYWQQHEGNYWGHNAIIRVQPFMDHCALPALPGSEPFGGRILSHDFVEAALMRKAGWAVWLAHDLEGSYEEGPPTLIDCGKAGPALVPGQPAAHLASDGLGFRPANRFHLLHGGHGVRLVGAVAAAAGAGHGGGLRPARHRFHGGSPAPDTTSLFGYRVQVPEAITLFVFTMLMLFLPKMLSVVGAPAARGGRPVRGPRRGSP